MSGRDIRKRRLKLWQQDPRCHWCGIETIEVVVERKKKPPANLSTLDHLRSRNNPDRREPGNGTERRLVISCWKCNHDRDRKETAELPIEVLHKRSKNHRKRDEDV